MIRSRHCKPCNTNWDTDDEPFSFCPMCGSILLRFNKYLKS